MPEVSRSDVEEKVTALRQCAEEGFGDAGSRIQWARQALQEAMTAGIDVSDLEAQMPELEKGAIRQNAVQKVTDLRQCVEEGFGDAGSRIQWARQALQEAMTAGIDVSDLEAQMPELKQKAQERSSK